MTDHNPIPEYVCKLTPKEHFSFACHSAVPCFTECCRMLELAVTPYDVLRLRLATGLHSTALLDEYLLVEQEPGEPFPRVYLTMIDDGRASCVFVSAKGCTVYAHRPAACRAYPLGRAVIRRSDPEQLEEHYVLLKEQHCLGFQQTARQDLAHYSQTQGLLPYNHFNDRLAVILQHEAVRLGFIPSQGQSQFFLDTLYDLDRFRERCLADSELRPAEKARFAEDESLLLFAMDLVEEKLFADLPKIFPFKESRRC
jgi:uncharacterized protein